MEIKIVTGEEMPEKVRQAAGLLKASPVALAKQLKIGEYLQFPPGDNDVMIFTRNTVHAQDYTGINLYADTETLRLWRVA